MLLRVIVAFLCLVPLLSGAEEAPLTSFAEVRALSSEESQEQRPVAIEGTVLYFMNDSTNKGVEGMVVHDGTAGCYVSSPVPFAERARLQPGAQVRIKGVTSSRVTYFPFIQKAEVEFLGQGALPKPRALPSSNLFDVDLDSEWIEMEGVVVGREADFRGVTLVVEVDGNVFKATVSAQGDVDERVADLVQRRVKFSAVLATVLNAENQMAGRYFLIPSFDHIVPFTKKALKIAVPEKPIKALLTRNHGINSAVGIRGVVTQSRGNGFYLRDSTGSAFVQALEGQRYPPGSEVRVAGYATVAPFRPGFRAYHIELLGEGELPKPIPYEPAQGFRVDLHGERVSIDADFLSRRELREETILYCRAGERFFEARLPGPDLYARNLTVGDMLRLTGVYEVSTSHPLPRVDRVDGFRVHLASDADIVVLRQAPWWTLERLLLALGVLVTVLFGVFIWNWLLRKRVAVQAETIVSQVEQGIVKDERQRIARELHDTVEQELTGVSMQLGNLSSTIEEDEVAGKRLALARNMLKRCREETRASISDLRDPQLTKRRLPEALRVSLAAVAEQGAVELDYKSVGTPRVLQVATKQHLLRMGREAMMNTIKHAEATCAEVRLSYDDKGIVIEVSDDGHGFDVTQRPPTGHFGLIGMRERANKIHAAFSIDSSPDTGTTIRIEMPWTSPAALPESQL